MSNGVVRLVGHRGWPAAYPENSLQGLEAALSAGADAVEFDVQLSADGVFMMLHDPCLLRVGGVASRVDALDAAELAAISVHEPARLGQAHFPTPVARLQQVIALLQAWPRAQVFLELKSEIFKRLAREEAVRQLLPMVEALGERCVIIAFDLPVLRCVQAQSTQPVGWVLSRYSRDAKAQLAHQPVDYLICDLKKIPARATALWPGPWQWFVYDVVAPHDLQRCLNLRIPYLETWDVQALRALLERN